MCSPITKNKKAVSFSCAASPQMQQDAEPRLVHTKSRNICNPNSTYHNKIPLSVTTILTSGMAHSSSERGGNSIILGL